MDELFYCNCGNKGPDGAECPDCHSYFALQSHKSISSGLAHLSSILFGVFLGFVAGSLIIYLVRVIPNDIPHPNLVRVSLQIFALPWTIIGGVLGNKAYKSWARKSRQKA